MLGKARWLEERTGRSGTRAEPGPRQATRACRPLAPRPAAVIGGCRDASTKNDGGTRNHGFSRSRPRATNAHAGTSGKPPNSASGRPPTKSPTPPGRPPMPPPRPETRPPRPSGPHHWRWSQDRWHWNGRRWVWVPGRWRWWLFECTVVTVREFPSSQFAGRRRRQKQWDLTDSNCPVPMAGQSSGGCATRSRAPSVGAA